MYQIYLDDFGFNLVCDIHMCFVLNIYIFLPFHVFNESPPLVSPDNGPSISMLFTISMHSIILIPYFLLLHVWIFHEYFGP